MLWVAVMEDDEQSFEQLKVLLTPALSQIASSMVDPASVDDVVEATWDQAWKKRRSYKGEPQPLNWLYPIMRGVAHEPPTSLRILRRLTGTVRNRHQHPRATELETSRARVSVHSTHRRAA
jgi:DNA-directed RNA polymerase specialized sigma24 family protein